MSKQPPKMKNTLFVFCGGSGAGKSTIQHNLTTVAFLTNYCTRPLRDGEEPGKHIHPVTKDIFKLMVKEGKMLEWKEYDGELYGTPEFVRDTEYPYHCTKERSGIESLIRELGRERLCIIHIWAPDEYRIERMKAQGRSDAAIRRRLEADKPLIPYYFEVADYNVRNLNLQEAQEEVASIIDKELGRDYRSEGKVI